MSFIDISYLLESLDFFTIFFDYRIPSIPVDHMKACWCTEINWVNRGGWFLVEDLSLNIFTHVLYDGSLPIHSCCLLSLSLCA